MARHALPQSSHEQQLPGDRWTRIEERRTADGGSIGIRVDITDLKRSEASFRLLFEENPLPMWVADANYRATVGGQHGDVLPLRLSARRTARDVGARPQRRRPLSVGAGTDAAGAHHTQDSRGDLIEVVIESRPLPYQGKAGLVSVAFDVTERNRAEQRVRYLASHDLLTDLPNRAAFDARLATLMQHSGDAGGTSSPCFASIWITSRKSTTCSGIRPATPCCGRPREGCGRPLQGAFVARVGGDEFIAITEPGADARSRRTAGRPDARRLEPADRNRRPRGCDIELSVGVGALPARRRTSLPSLLGNADAALYGAKSMKVAGRSASSRRDDGPAAAGAAAC